MKLEEAIKILDNMRKTINESKMLFDEPVTVKLTEENTGLAIETVLQALENDLEKKDKLIKEILLEYIDKTVPTVSQCRNKELRKYLLESYNNAEVDSIYLTVKRYFENKIKE